MAAKTSGKRTLKRKGAHRQGARKSRSSGIDLNFRAAWVDKISDLEANEVEIACIAIESVLSDVACVLARRDKGKIYYRVIDDNGFTYGKCSSRLPLTLGELTNLFVKAWDLLEVLESNFKEDGYPPERVRAFFEGSWRLGTRRSSFEQVSLSGHPKPSPPFAQRSGGDRLGALLCVFQQGAKILEFGNQPVLRDDHLVDALTFTLKVRPVTG